MNLFDVLFAKKLGGGSPFPPVIKRVTGNPIEFTDGADAPLVKCVTQITGYQQGSGTPSPDNIRPIVAYTEGEIEVSDGDGNTTTHTTTYPSAIYRGSEDVVNGKVTGEKIALKITDASTATIKYYSELTGRVRVEYFPLRGLVKLNSAYICDCFEGKTLDNAPYQVANGSGASRCFFTFPPGTSEADCLSALATLQPTIVYEPATPTTSSVTPTNLPIKSLSGYNHIESSTGEMVVDYITEGYQNFVDTTERAVPSTRKGGVKAFDIFKTLDEPKAPEASAEGEPEEKETEEDAKR